jgi:hypothetical protein
MAQVGADERTQGDDRKAPGAEVVQGAGNKASPQPLALEGGLDLGVDKHDGARFRLVSDWYWMMPARVAPSQSS